MTSRSSSKCSEVTEHSVQRRFLGWWRKERPSRCSRVIQIGSWWETTTASWPWAARRASWTAAIIRPTTSRYGSPQEGRHGFHRCRQVRGSRSALRPAPNRSPSKTLPDSMTRSSVRTSSPRAAASGAIVSCTRSSGEATRWVMSRWPSASATFSAIATPRSERWKPSRRP